MNIMIIGLRNFDYLDLCDILGNDWCKVADRHDDLIDVYVDIETVELKVSDKIWLRKGSKIADIEPNHFVKIEIA